MFTVDVKQQSKATNESKFIVLRVDPYYGQVKMAEVFRNGSEYLKEIRYEKQINFILYHKFRNNASHYYDKNAKRYQLNHFKIVVVYFLENREPA